MTTDLIVITGTVHTVTDIIEAGIEQCSVVNLSMINSIDILPSFFKQVSHVIKIGGKSDT